MKNNKKNLNKVYISLALLMLLGISFVSAFAVSSPYMPDKQLILSQDSGATDLQFILQNGGGATEAMNIKVNILDGSDIATIIDENETYLIVPGDKVPVNLRINVPANAAIGSTYNVRLEFITASSGASGQFGFGTGQEQSFTVVVGEKITIPEEKESNKNLLYIILGILVLLVIIVLVIIKRKNRK